MIGGFYEPHVLYALLETLGSLRDVVQAAGHEGRATALEQEAAATLSMIQASELPAEDREHLLGFARRVGLGDQLSSSSD